MDLVCKTAIDISTLALDGLSARHNMIAANIANADTPGYKRVDLKFEDQLQKILGNERARQAQKESYSAGLTYSPNSLITPPSETQMSNIIDKKTNFDSFNPEVITNDSVSIRPDGNNVNIEYEMAELSKNGMKYTAITALQEKMFRGMQDVIKGGGM